MPASGIVGKAPTWFTSTVMLGLRTMSSSPEPTIGAGSTHRSGYTTFLRSVMSTTTVLYLGFSFTDAYLDDLRSEILALLDYQGGDHPIAYALLHGVDDDEIAFAREHEGIEILPYEPGDDFTGFDDFLGDLHAATNPTALLGDLLSGARILWVDPDEASIDHGMQFLENAASGRASIERFDTPRAAIDAASEAKTDLIVTRWGHGQGAGGEPAAIELLTGLRQRAAGPGRRVRLRRARR